jgi:hypothetical protein
VLGATLRSRAGRIGIFYGAAHMPDMEQRLRADFGLAWQKTVWVDAWQLGADAAAPASN